MNKVGAIILIIFFVGFAYAMMMLFQPTINTLVETANSSSNWTAHSSFGLAQGALVGWPFWSYLVPGSIGVAVAIGVLKRDK